MIRSRRIGPCRSTRIDPQRLVDRLVVHAHDSRRPVIRSVIPSQPVEPASTQQDSCFSQRLRHGRCAQRLLTLTVLGYWKDIRQLICNPPPQN
jgi:hypothetical protein